MNLQANAASGGDAASDVISGFEDPTGSASADTLTDNGSANVIEGGTGNDVLVGGAGNDTIDGGDGNDTIDGGAGNDTIEGWDGNEVLVGGAGNDTLTGGAGGDHFVFNDPTEGSDNIVDFNSGQGDLIYILISAFGGGLTTGTAPSTVFGSSTTSTFTSGTERFHYNTTTNTLLFDADGSGAGAAQAIAVFNNAVALAGTDFNFI